MFKRLALSLSLLLTVFFSLAPAVAHAALFDGSKGSACSGVALQDTTSCDQNATKKANDIVAVAINIFTVVVGIIAVVMMIVGGLKYITSQGDPAQTNSAKNTILFAAVGLVVAALAQVIVRFVLTKFK